MTPSLVVVLALVLFVALRRPRRARGTSQSMRMALLVVVALVAAQPQRVPPPRAPDERRRPQTPPQGTPVAQAADAGAAPDGGTTMLAGPQRERYAGEAMAVDYEASDRFQPGRPVSQRMP